MAVASLRRLPLLLLLLPLLLLLLQLLLTLLLRSALLPWRGGCWRQLETGGMGASAVAGAVASWLTAGTAAGGVAVRWLACRRRALCNPFSRRPGMM